MDRGIFANALISKKSEPSKIRSHFAVESDFSA